jgi:hypothetical protein
MASNLFENLKFGKFKNFIFLIKMHVKKSTTTTTTLEIHN